jgi:hypothetical protein
MADEIKEENSLLKKVRDKNDKKFIKRIQERRYESHIQNEASKHKILQA